MDTMLTDLEELALLALLRVGPDAHGAAIQQVLGERAGRPVTLGSLYNALVRMEERGLVESELGEPTQKRGGKAKRLYRVTPEGHRALTRARRVHERMWKGLPEAPAP